MTPQEAINILNRILDKDKEAVSKLIIHRVPCNRALADVETTQVRLEDDKSHTVSMLGVLNGIFGQVPDGKYKGWGWITAVLEKDGTISKFMLTTETNV